MGKDHPDGRQAEGFRQPPGRRQKNDQLPDQGGQHAVESASQSLKDRTQNDAAAGHNKAETDDAHGRNADSQHMVGGVKDSKQLFRNHTEESQAGQHQKSGGDCAETDGAVDPQPLPGAVVIGDNGPPFRCSGRKSA